MKHFRMLAAGLCSAVLLCGFAIPAYAYMRKMALSGYVLHVDLSPVRELVSLQRRCSNNLNQVAIQANTYGAIYPEELAALQRDYAALWGPLSDLLKQLSALVEL